MFKHVQLVVQGHNGECYSYRIEEDACLWVAMSYYKEGAIAITITSADGVFWCWSAE